MEWLGMVERQYPAFLLDLRTPWGEVGETVSMVGSSAYISYKIAANQIDKKYGQKKRNL
jgi:hypothetical protein